MKYMIALKTPGLLTSMQLVAIVVASLIVWVELDYDYEQLAKQGAEKVADTPSSGNKLNYSAMLDDVITVHTLPMYREIAERPLFSPERRPSPKEQPAMQQAVAKEPMDYSLKLNGVSITDKAKTALVWHTTERKFYEVERGDTVKNWKVQEIKPESVVLSQNGTNMELVLWEKPGSTP